MKTTAEGQKVPDEQHIAMKFPAERPEKGKGKYKLLREKCTCVLNIVECSFVSNKEDEALQTEGGTEQKIVGAVVKGIVTVQYMEGK